MKIPLPWASWPPVSGIERIVKGLSYELRDQRVTALGVTPGWLRSEKMLEDFGVTEDNWRDALAGTPGFGISESPSYLGRGVAALAADDAVARFGGKILTSRELADLYGLTDTDGSRPDCWGLIEKYGIDHHSTEGIAGFR